MKRVVTVLIAGLALTWCANSGFAETDSAKANVQRGKDIYKEQCIRCHAMDGSTTDVGKKLKPFPAKDLRPNNLLPSSELKMIIKYGLFMRAMEAKPLSDSDIDAVIAYLRTLTYKPDAAHGKKRFLEVCAVCHGDDAKGKSNIGTPNLHTATLSEVEMARIIRMGKHNTPMTPKRDALSNTEIADVIAYFMTLRQ